MGILTAEMKRLVREQRLCYVATVDRGGNPRLSPKGMTTVWDEDHLAFAEIRSPGLVANLRRNPSVEVNVVDPHIREGYLFKGKGTVLTEGPQYEQIVASYRERAVTNRIRAVVLVEVNSASPLGSPAYASD
jgi:predicted pyridoxine 5'-phosphate oxidase superfamily flavin-nucleotide-binding protein